MKEIYAILYMRVVYFRKKIDWFFPILIKFYVN